MIPYFLYPLEQGYNYEQLIHCLDLDLWLANFKICVKILSGWPQFVWSHCNNNTTPIHAFFFVPIPHPRISTCTFPLRLTRKRQLT